MTQLAQNSLEKRQKESLESAAFVKEKKQATCINKKNDAIPLDINMKKKEMFSFYVAD